MNRYHNGKIYKLVNTVDDRIYIGSSASELSKRLYHHKKDARKRTEQKVYKELNIIGWENVRIIQIEAFRCENKQELTAREQYHMDLLKPDLNKNASSGQQCIHNIRRTTCIHCGGGSMCMHNKQKRQCKDCVGSAICEHNKRRIDCKICSPVICEICDITTSKYNFNRHLKSDKHKNMVLLSAVIESN
jgi:group I intron endonuclease